MPKDIKTPEEQKEAMFEILYIRNFNKKTKIELEHIAVNERVSMSKLINRIGKEFVKNYKENGKWNYLIQN